MVITESFDQLTVAFPLRVHAPAHMNARVPVVTFT
jgi:hypothetical protein